MRNCLKDMELEGMKFCCMFFDLIGRKDWARSIGRLEQLTFLRKLRNNRILLDNNQEEGKSD